MILKVTKKQSFTLSSDSFLKYIYRVKEWIFFKYNFNISFCRISNLSFHLNKNELRKNCWENHYVKGVTPDIIGICPRTPKFWHTYVITYGDFMVIVKPLDGN